MHQLRNGHCHFGQVLRSCVEVVFNSLFFHRRPLLLCGTARTAQVHKPLLHCETTGTAQRGLAESQTLSGKPRQILAQQDGGASFGTAAAAVISPTVALNTSAWSAVAITVGWTVIAEFRLPERVKDSGAISMSEAALMSGRQSNAAQPWQESMWAYS